MTIKEIVVNKMHLNQQSRSNKYIITICYFMYLLSMLLQSLQQFYISISIFFW